MSKMSGYCKIHGTYVSIWANSGCPKCKKKDKLSNELLKEDLKLKKLKIREYEEKRSVETLKRELIQNQEEEKKRNIFHQFLSAVTAGDQGLVERILTSGAINIDHRDSGKTALLEAAKSKNLEMVAFLTRRGADINENLPASTSDYSVFRALIKAGGKIDSLTEDERTEYYDEDDWEQLLSCLERFSKDTEFDDGARKSATIASQKLIKLRDRIEKTNISSQRKGVVGTIVYWITLVLPLVALSLSLVFYPKKISTSTFSSFLLNHFHLLSLIFPSAYLISGIIRAIIKKTTFGRVISSAILTTLLYPTLAFIIGWITAGVGYLSVGLFLGETQANKMALQNLSLSFYVPLFIGLSLLGLSLWIEKE